MFETVSVSQNTSKKTLLKQLEIVLIIQRGSGVAREGPGSSGSRTTPAGSRHVVE